MGGPNDDLVGIEKRAPGAVDFSAADRRDTRPRLGKHGTFGRSCFSVPWTINGRAAGLDAEHARYSYSECCDAGPAGTRRRRRIWRQARRCCASRTILGAATDAATAEGRAAATAHARGT